MDKVSKEGVITVEESQTIGMEIDVVEGMQFDNGYISPYMITDPDRMEAVHEKPAVLVTDSKISSVKEILPILEGLSQAGRKDLVIICEDIEGEALATLIVNKLRGTFNPLAIKAPGFGDRRKAMLQDIAILTGATLVTEDVGLKLESASVEVLGEARRVIASKDNTTIVEGKGDEKQVKDRVKQIKAQIESSNSDFDSDKLKERLAKLSGGVAVIKVGAASEVEMKEKKHRIEDALAATRCAVEEGIVPGGGVALLNALKSLDSIKADNEDEEVGVDIVRRALLHPLRQIASNAGKDGSVVVAQVMGLKRGHGYDALNDKDNVDMIAAGIVDPTKVTRTALQNGASVAALFLTTEACVSEIAEDKPAMPPMPGGMGGMGGMGMPGMM